MKLVPKSTFWMGCEKSEDHLCYVTEQPKHKVTVSPYYLDVHEVTVADYNKCVKSGKCPQATRPQDPKYTSYCAAAVPGLEDRPVNCVSWHAAMAYCKFRDIRNRLPTEAEWELAARGPQSSKYPWGTAAKKNLLGIGNTTFAPTPPGSHPDDTSPLGFKDMAGSVREWTWDNYGAYYYKKSPGTDPTGPADPKVWYYSRSVRGNRWRDVTHSSNGPRYNRGAYRRGLHEHYTNYDTGFRCARPLK